MTNLIQKIFPLTATGIVGLSTICCVAPATSANLYNQFFIFGDSLVDAGNLYNLTGGQVPPHPFVNGRFSNGLVWSDYLASDFGLTPSLSILGPGQFIDHIPDDGINFAIGGAKTDDTHITGLPLPGLPQQITLFSNLLGGNTIDNSQALGILSIGPNDYLGGETNPTIPISNITNQVRALIDLGLENILIANMPDLGRPPLAQSLDSDVSEGLTQLTIAHNNLLNLTINQLIQENPEVKLITFDLFKSFNKILANPEFNITKSCTKINLLDPTSLEGDLFKENCSEDDFSVQNQFLFFDNQHPNTKAHRLIADSAKSTLIPEPSLISGILLLGVTLFSKKIISKKTTK